MVQPGKIRVDNLQLVVDLVHQVVVQLMVVQFNQHQVILSLPQTLLLTLQQMDGDIKVEQEILMEIPEGVVVPEVLAKLLMHQMVVTGDLVCNFLQHSGILHKVLEHRDQQIHLHIIQDGLTSTTLASIGLLVVVVALLIELTQQLLLVLVVVMEHQVDRILVLVMQRELMVEVEQHYKILDLVVVDLRDLQLTQKIQIIFNLMLVMVVLALS
tara:strand:- start:52 stop:690 length:639 start_codon:yes stop_codon:yes gene_type:complete